MGLIIAALSTGTGVLLACSFDGPIGRLSFFGGLTTIPMALIALLVTYVIRQHMHSLEPDLMRQFRASAVYFRVAIFMVLAILGMLTWFITAAVAEDLWLKFSPFDNSGTAFLACMLGAPILILSTL